MSEVSGIIENATEKSLVILDELGCGTCNDEGIAISWSIMEMLILKQSLVILTTHSLYLTRMAKVYPHVKK